MKKFAILTILFFSIFFYGNSQPRLVDKVIAVVGDEIVLLSDVEMQYQQSLLQTGLETESKCEILNQMLLNKMLLTQAKVDSLFASDEEIESELERRLRHFISLIGSKEKLEEYYNKTILEIKEEFREDISDYLLITKMQSRITKEVRVTPSEIKNFFRAIPKDSLPYYNAAVELGQIMIYAKVSDFQKAYAKEKITRIRERIIEGEDFGSLAEIYSEDGSAIDGGELGFHERGEMNPEFEAVAFRLKENEVSKVVESKFGYHIIKLIEKRGEKINVRHIIIKPKITSFELKKAKNKLDSIRKEITEKRLTFTEAVSLYSEDEDSKNNGGMLINPQSGNSLFEMDQISRDVFIIIENMKVGQISASTKFNSDDGRQAYRIILLKSQSEPHQANLKDDYHRIQSVALANAQNMKMSEWLEEKLLETYTKIDNKYKDCSELKNWFKNNTQ